MYETVLFVDTVLLESAIDCSTNAISNTCEIDWIGQVSLVEEREDFVANLEQCRVLANCFDDTCTI